MGRVSKERKGTQPESHSCTEVDQYKYMKLPFLSCRNIND